MGDITLELHVAGRPDPVWQTAMHSESRDWYVIPPQMPGMPTREKFDQTTLRREMLQQLGMQIMTMEMPYFISAEEGVASLPAAMPDEQ